MVEAIIQVKVRLLADSLLLQDISLTSSTTGM